MLFAVDLGLIAFLTFHAHRDGRGFSLSTWLHLTNKLAADGLDRFELPFFGGLASSFVDAE